MLGFVGKWLGRRDEAPRTPVTGVRRLPLKDVEDESIPRYPPFAKGLPVAPIDAILATQAELIERIRTSLGLTVAEFEHMVFPVIERYAAFVHLLPASEAHHHRGAGGLFRHGLEVAFWAAQSSGGVMFAIAGTPRERRDNEPRWRLACCFAGLLHDVGKPLTDVSVTNKDGTLNWNPYNESLHDWAIRHGIDSYFLRWRDKRHKRHEQFSLLAVDRIIPAPSREFLTAPGPAIMEALLEAIAGTSATQTVTRLMLRADKESVARDLRESRINVDEFAYGVPVERYVFDAIRRLVNTGRWKVNEPGAKVWHLRQGTFIAWRQLGDLYDLITQDNIPGIPRDPDTLADVLIERGFAVPCTVAEKGEQAHYRYWSVLPEMLQESTAGVTILMLRLESDDLVFTTEPPPALRAHVVGEPDEIALEGAQIPIDAPTAPGATPAITLVPEDAAEEALVSPPVPPDVSSGDDFPFDAFGVENMDAPAFAPDGAGAQGSATSVVATEQPDASNIRTTVSTTEPTITPSDVLTVQHDLAVRVPPPAASPDPTSEAPGAVTTSARDALAALLKTYGSAAPLLEQVILPVLTGEVMLGEALCLIDGQAVILHPDGVRRLGAPAEVISALFQAHAITPDPILPGRKVRDFGGIKAVALTDAISRAIVAAAAEAEDALDGAQGVPVKTQRKDESKDESRDESKGKGKGRGGQRGAPSSRATTDPEMRPQNIARMPRRPSPPPPPAPIPDPVVVPRHTEEPEEGEVDLPAFELACPRTQPPVVHMDDLLPASIEPDRAIQMLKDMIRARSGKWLASPVVKEKGFLVTSAQALDLVAEDANISRHTINGWLSRNGSTQRLTKNRGKLYLEMEPCH